LPEQLYRHVPFMLRVLRNRRTGVSVFVTPAYLGGGK
jgi:hypothetical protein